MKKYITLFISISLVIFSFSRQNKKETPIYPSKEKPLKTNELTYLQDRFKKEDGPLTKEFKLLKTIPRKGFRKRGENSLLIAAQNNMLSRMETLLKLGVSPDLNFNNVNYKLLMEASFENDIAQVKLLLKYGANPLERDSDGKSAIDYAVHEYNYHIIPLLLESISKTDYLSAKREKDKIIKHCQSGPIEFCHNLFL